MRSPTGADSRVVLIFGATSGIGLASALRFAARGDRLVLLARSAESLGRVADRCRALGSADVESCAIDIAVRSEVEAEIELAIARHGRIDVVVLSSSLMAYGTVETIPAEVFERTVQTAIFGTANVARAVLPQFRRQRAGILIVINSLLGSVTVPKMSAYAVSKWGQRALVRTLQQEVRRERGVRVCLVSPGSVNTPIYYQAANYVGRQPRPPWPIRSPEHVGEVVERLADRPRQHVSVPVGVTNPLIISGFRLLPFVYDRIVGALFGLLSLTRRPIEPTAGNVEQPRPDAERMHGHWPDLLT